MCLAPSSKEVNQQTLLTNSSSLFMPINREVTPNDTYTHTHIHKGGFSQLKCSKETTGSGSEACFCTIEEKQKAPVNRFVFFLSSFFPFYHLRSFTLLSDRYVCIVYSKGQDRLNNNNKKAVQQRHRVRPVGKWERRLQESIFLIAFLTMDTANGTKEKKGEKRT